MDFSQFSDSDLKALAKGDYAKVSDAGLAAHAQIEAARQQATQQAGPQAFKPAENIDKVKLNQGSINSDPMSRAPAVNKGALRQAADIATATATGIGQGGAGPLARKLEPWEQEAQDEHPTATDVGRRVGTGMGALLGAKGLGAALPSINATAKAGVAVAKEYAPTVAAGTYVASKLKSFLSGE